tara:strand:- start:141 stop:941 length:801 start_codon:yes stop_codon:yes gene_type:complete
MSQLFYNYPVEEFLTLDPSNTTGSPYNNMILTIEQKIPKEFENLMDVKNELYKELNSDCSELFSEIINENTNNEQEDNKIDDEKKEDLHKFNEDSALNKFSDILSEFKKEFKDVQNKFIKIDEELKNEAIKTELDINNLENMINFVNNIDKSYSEEEEIKKINENIILLSTKIKNNCKLKESKKSYVQIRMELNKYFNIIRSLNNMNTTTTCGLCLTNKIDQYINPCGHCFCGECKERLISYEGSIANANCPICRGNILDFKKLFI